jgi:hypothetical protein
MATGKVFAAILLLILFLPAAEACFVTSSIDVQIEQSDQVILSPTESLTLTANLTLTWGFGAFLPLPVNIYVDVTQTPSWVHVSPINSFAITPQGIRGGSESRTLSIKLSSSEETNAFVFQDLTIHAFTNGSFLVRGSEHTQTIQVAQDFKHLELAPQTSVSAISVTTGDTQRVYLNMTNRCNADLSVSVTPMNFSTDWSIRMDRSDFIIPSTFTGDPEVSIPVVFKAESSSEENGWLEITYYPLKDAEWGPVTKTVPLQVNSQDERMPIGSIAILLIGLLIIIVIVVLIWRKYRQPQDF